MGTLDTAREGAAVEDRLRRLRRAKWTGAAVVVAGVVGLVAFSAGGEDAPGTTSPRSARDAARGEDPDAPARPGARPTVAPAAPPRVGPRRPVRVRVSGPKGPEPGVLVRATQTDSAAGAQRDCGTTATTDAEGLVIVDVDDPAPAGVLLELALADQGLRHALVPLQPGAPEPVAVFLPAGGRLAVRIEGAFAGRRIPPVTVKIFPPYGEHLSLFSGAEALPAADGGLQECNAVPRAWRFPFDENGRAVVPHVPGDHAVLLEVATPDDRVVESAVYDGPRVETGSGDVLRVPDGADAVYTVVLREPPAVRVRVVGDDGRPLEGARVAVGFRHGESATRILAHGEVSDAAGNASVPLWSGPRLPAWTPEGLVLVASAPGRAARVVEAKPAWYGVEAEIALPPAPAGRFALAGALTFENGKPAAGVPLLLATAEPWNGHAALDPLGTVTDGEGRFRIEVPEALRPVLAFGGGALSLRVDAGRLEEQSRDALWRSVWPSLPRARAKPDAFPLPAVGAVVKADAMLVLP